MDGDAELLLLNNVTFIQMRTKISIKPAFSNQFLFKGSVLCHIS